MFKRLVSSQESRVARLLTMVVLLAVSLGFTSDLEGQAKARKSSARKSNPASRSSSKSKASGKHSRSKNHQVSRSRHGSKGHASKHHKGKHAHHHAHHVHKRAPRYAYDPDLFLMKAPDFDQSPLPYEQASEIMRSFTNGTADQYPARMLVRAGAVKYHPMRGGIFWRREKIKHIIMHSTETGVPVSAVRVIESWSSGGRRHPGAQYVVERDGTIYQACDPDLATVHINIFKTLPGINNDNSIGIEMNHTGRQDYPEAQLNAVHRLVNYLQARYNITDDNIITHRYAQQGDHTDPVAFDWSGFLWRKNRMRAEALAYKSKDIERNSVSWRPQAVVTEVTDVPPTTILQPHMSIRSVPDPASPNPGFNTPPTPIQVQVSAPVAVPVPAVRPLTPATVTTPAAATVVPPAPAAVIPPSQAPMVSTPTATPSVFGAPASPASSTTIVPPSSAVAPLTPSTVTTPLSPIPTFNTTPGASTTSAPDTTIPSTTIFAAPQRLGPNGHPMPVLRGPIEVSPTHAGDVNTSDINAAPQQ